MTEKRFFQNKSLEEDSFVISDGVIDRKNDRIIRYDKEYCDLLNELNDENEQLKSSFTEFAKMIEFDMDKGIEVYPKTLLEYIINISKEYGK